MRVLLCLLLSSVGLAAETKFKLVLEENFEGTAVNEKIWNVETGKRKDAVNSEKSVDVKNGQLTITTWTDADGTTYCGFVTTRKKFALTQGKTEARCRFAVAPGTQSAFWAQSETYGQGGPTAAATAGVEIDILETTGVMKGTYQYALNGAGMTIPRPTRRATSGSRPPQGRLGMSTASSGMTLATASLLTGKWSPPTRNAPAQKLRSSCS